MEQNAQTRPDVLKLLCILTFIGSGLAGLANLFIWSSFDEIQNIMEDIELNLPEMKLLLSGGKQFFIAGFFLYSVSLAGAIQMWKLKKIGFHLYTASQIFLLILPLVTIKDLPFSYFGLLLSLVFIGGYFSQLRFMK